MMVEGISIYLLCRLAVGLISSALVVATVMPLLRSDIWWIRVFDFPRIQIAVLIGLTLAGYAMLHFFEPMRPWEYGLSGILGLSLIWQLYSIAPYTKFHPSEMARSDARDESSRISILVFNVLADNREVEALRDLVRDHDPDIVLLSEPNRRWLEQLDGLEEAYPHTLFQPRENKYGLLLYSKLELEDPEIRYLIEPGIPSIRTKVRLRSGKVVVLYGIHPRPPGIQPDDKEKNRGPGKDEDSDREDSDKRDAELLLVAKEVKALGDVPVIVAGDFNDVAWSRTTHLFQRIGGLLDPRVGRGLFNTFDTGNRLLRFPLDHVFASRHFLLVELRRLPDIGSDHFPIFVVFDHAPGGSSENEEPRADAGDHREAREAIDKEK